MGRVIPRCVALVGRGRLIRMHWLLASALVVAAPLGAEPCAVADSLLDVSEFSGPGGGYEQPRVAAECAGDVVVVRSNGVPHYEFVQVTPRPLAAQNHVFRIPKEPELAAEPTSIPLLGQAGFAVNGVAFFGPNEGPVPAVERFGDPIFNSIMDECLGHTAGEYHYHAFHQPCLTNGVKEGQRSPVLGYAFDGFAIRGPFGCADGDCSEVIRMRSSYVQVGDPSINAWDAYAYREQDGTEFLDRCNGHTDPAGDYHYHSTATFPYIIGCYAGTPMRAQRGGARDATQQRGRRGRRGARRATGGARGGGQRGGGRGPFSLEGAASRLGLTAEELAAALDVTALRSHLRDPENVEFDFAGPAVKLRVNEEELRQALEHQVATPVRYRGHRPGCTMTPDGYLLCHPNVVRGLVEQIQGGGQ